jgi:hypothetical protein
MECFGTTDFDNNSRLITLSAIIISDLHCIYKTQDNAPPHKARIVTEFLVEQGIETLRHPPYSPDIAPSDFSLFDTLKLSEGDNFLRHQV